MKKKMIATLLTGAMALSMVAGAATVMADDTTETKEKLSKIRPKNLAQASRIGGVKPADISILMVMLDKHMIKS